MATPPPLHTTPHLQSGRLSVYTLPLVSLPHTLPSSSLKRDGRAACWVRAALHEAVRATHVRCAARARRTMPHTHATSSVMHARTWLASQRHVCTGRGGDRTLERGSLRDHVPVCPRLTADGAVAAAAVATRARVARTHTAPPFVVCCPVAVGNTLRRHQGAHSAASVPVAATHLRTAAAFSGVAGFRSRAYSCKLPLVMGYTAVRASQSSCVGPQPS